MEVISGKIPRPSSSHGPPLGRSSSPFIQRVPSEDAMERSSHNESGHGKSTAQIIKELRTSNARLTAKSAEIEADFMNQINQVTLKFSEEQRELEESLEKKEKMILEMESRGSSSENRIRDRDTSLLKLKEETAFQRHTIADLKNQLYQQQNDIEEAEYDKNDEVDKWKIEKQEMSREIETIKKQFQESRDENENLRCQLAERALEGSNVMQNWKKLEETKKELAESQRYLHEAKSSLATLEHESKKLQKEQETELCVLRFKVTESQVILSTKEREWREKIEVAQQNDVMQSKIDEQETIISSLRDEITTYTKQVAELLCGNTKLQAEAETRNIFRHDEVSDLRVLNDAQSEELQRLKEECDEMDHEISERDDALLESMSEADQLQKQVNELTLEVNVLRESHGAETDERILQLETALQESNEAYRKLDDEIKMKTEQYENNALQFRKELTNLVAERDDIHSRLAMVEEERDEAREIMDRNLQENRDEVESRLAKRLRDVVANAAKERADLEKEHDELLADFEKAKREEMASLQKVLDDRNREILSANNFTNHAREELEEVHRVSEMRMNELEEIKANLCDTESKVDEHARSLAVESEETEKLREKLEKEKKEVAQSQQALREAQIALVMLDDEKEMLATQIAETKAKWEAQRNEIIDDYEAQLLAKEEEMAQLTNRFGDAKHITELVMECTKMEEMINCKDAEIKKLTSTGRLNGSLNGHGISSGQGGALEDALRKELLAAKDAEEKLVRELTLLKSQKQEFECKVKVKLDDRDTTISTLVKSSVTQEQTLAKMKAEIETLKKSQRGIGSSNMDTLSVREIGAVKSARDADRREEIEQLHTALDECRDVERRLHGEILHLEKKLFVAENEVIRLKNLMDADVSNPLSRKKSMQYKLQRGRTVNAGIDNDQDEKLQERDSAIATLVKQSMAQEAFMKKLTAENEMLKEDVKLRSLRKQIGTLDGPTWDEMKKLQKESEIFASQIIEQDEEMQLLRLDLEDRDKEVTDLRRELADLQNDLTTTKTKSTSRDRDLDRIADLQAELDEMQEANETQRQEVRDLRRQIRDSQSALDSVDDLRLELEHANKSLSEMRCKVGNSVQQDASLRDELNESIASKDATEKRLEQQMESMRRLRVTAVEELEKKIRERDESIEELKRSAPKEEIESLKTEVERLKKDNDLKTSIAIDAQTSLQQLRKILDEQAKSDDGKAALIAEKATLMNEVAALKGKLDELEEDMVGINLLKARLREAEDGRETAEKNIMDSYERKITLMKLNKDVTIDNLRKELLEAKTQNSEIEEDMIKHIKNLEMENKDLKDELDAKLQLKNSKINALEQTLGAQEQLVENMRQEMDHLQGSMERSTIGRRAEIEEMQQEVIDSTGKAQKLEREITSLKMKLEQKELEHESQMNKLEERFVAMQESPLVTSMNKDTTDRIADLKEKFENLKWRNTSLQEENKGLRTKLERAQDTTATMKNDKYRASALESENESLVKRVEELEMERSNWGSSTAPSSRTHSSTQSAQQSSKPPTPIDTSSTRALSRIARSGSAPRGTKASSPSPSRKSSQGHLVSPSRSIKPSSASPGRFFLKRRPSNKHEAQKDDGSAASKLTF